MAKRTPSVIWAQRTDKLYVTIELENTTDLHIKIDTDKVIFQGKGGVDQAEYEVTIELYGLINPSESKFQVFSRNIAFILMRQEAGEYWPRLLKVKGRTHWLKTDFDKWKDEDDSDAEGDDSGQNFEEETFLGDDDEMMKQMGGGMGGMPGMGGMGGMPGMGGMGGMPGMGGMGGGMPPGMMDALSSAKDGMPPMDDGEDSDDEDLPDLE